MKWRTNIMTKRVHIIDDVKVNIINDKGDPEYVILVQDDDIIAITLSKAKLIAGIIDMV